MYSQEETYAQRLLAVYEKTRDPEDFLRCALEYEKLMKCGELSMKDKWEYATIHYLKEIGKIDVVVAEPAITSRLQLLLTDYIAG